MTESPLDAASEAVRAQDWSRAEAECLAFLERSPDDPAALNLLGMVAFATGRVARAAELIGRASRLAEDEPAYHRNLCELHRILNQSAEAIAHGEAAVALEIGRAHV